ncbi:MAG: AbrB family transcriptional regulator [Liquorilactobacillus nagelii]|jgi:antitoxin component of MazEF toxin-antitoxin module|uniref:AbrB family transcriptional regulator n=1 Tax=Liquorilactobacillus nagelii TaxID=82688 RepID=A0A3Q8CHH9_9LACO|nr:AbrB family transcriptional regulator [Liquorilactobacillus nagelii]AUJ32872.1 AbrB family transcriptional regulator [Liquorilactobacillus nagelii]MCC7616382.1 AbrB family transcriptional regulator [Liquorilactobacillus nagelii]MCI1699812.1 AbrB family transcriptional regulator [Liquorilactobacillus nagelii]MCP9315140.1 AbrB family transcriptional regulator [Liquorilactobacillus nagelii]
MTVKTRKQGNSIMVTIPAEFNIGVNAEYEPIIDANGVISFMPVRSNLFKQNPDYDLRKAINDEKIPDNGNLVGKEDFWHE